MQKFVDLINECLPHVNEIFPWDLSEQMETGVEMLILDVREPYEFDAMHIEDSLNVARGVLETAIEWDYEETIPDLVRARDDYVVVVCRSGNRSLLAARTMALMGFKNVVNLKTGLRGWSDYEQPLVDEANQSITLREGDAYFFPKVQSEQMRPKSA